MLGVVIIVKRHGFDISLYQAAVTEMCVYLLILRLASWHFFESHAC